MFSGKGTYRVDPQLSRTGLGNALLKNRIFSEDGQNITQNCITIGVVVTTQCWTECSPGGPATNPP